jgi:tetratricopeptide (TPR) repeat protein
MKKILLSLLLPVLLCLSAGAETPADLPGYVTPALQRLAEADEAFMHRDQPDRAREAFAVYREMHRKFPHDPEIAWRLSMASYHVGFHLARSRQERIGYYAEGMNAGIAAVNKSTSSAASYFWAGINMALYGQTVGPFKTISTLGRVRRYLTASAELDPSYAGAGAYRVLGTIERELPGILGGSRDQARVYFEKAIELVPDEPLNYLFLANLLKDRFNDTAGAVAVAERGLRVPEPSAVQIESVSAVGELRQFLRNNGRAARQAVLP